ncbi:MAG TPA: DUF6596 domain-containing protein [Caulobacteraceae bacterium]|nr:DUF6596 domain-containing protein [Caulobacteraceae bacterium]
MSAALDRAVRADGGRVIAALAARFRDLDLAEDAFAEACAAATAVWPGKGAPADAAAWLYAAAARKALDAVRRRAVRGRLMLDDPEPGETPEEALMRADQPIPDERLRLIFVCCHPAVAPDARAALTLKLVCGLDTGEIAAAFLISEPTLAQRLVRAKRKIAEAGVPFEVPGPDAWPERMDAVLSTLEIAYAGAHADAAGAGERAGLAEEVLRLTAVLAQLAPDEPEALALAATVRFAEARRPARLDETGAMVPLDRQDASLWRADLIAEGERLLARAAALNRTGPRQLQAAIHAAHCTRLRTGRTPWRSVLTLYDALLAFRPDPVVRLNRAVGLAQVAGAEAALKEVEALYAPALARWLPYHAARAHLLAEVGRTAEAADAFAAALALDPAPAERLYLERRRREVA